jgi:anion-transporting  ArsA/GET3 family ATPase
MDALDLLKQMHREAESAFEKLEAAKPGERQKIWKKLSGELVLHEQIEERFVYDPAAKAKPELERFHEHHEEEVREVAGTMEKLGEIDPEGFRFLEMIKELHQTLGQHIEEEESGFWPSIRRDWGSDELEKAAEPVKAARDAASHGAGMSKAMGAATAAAGGR